MKILNINSTTPSPRESLLGRKIQLEITGREFAIIRALLGAATTEMGLYSAFQNLVPETELSEAKRMVKCRVLHKFNSIELLLDI